MELQDTVIIFRKAMEEDVVKAAYMPFNTFPAGSCFETCIILADYLNQYGFGEFYYVLGENVMQQTHAWLENDLYLIDITAYQFERCTEKVIIKPIGRKPTNHLNFIEAS